jgi:hypothetical protein
MASLHRSLAFVGCLVSAVAISSPSQAGEEESKTFFAQGRELRLQGKCADAIALFKKALETYPDGLGSLRNVAECEEELSRFASARRSYWALRAAALKSTETKYDGWDTYAAESFARLGPKVPKLIVRVRNAPTSATVRVDGRPIDASLVDTEIEQDVGEVEVVLEDGAAPLASKRAILQQGKTAEVLLEAPAGAASAKGPAGTTPPATTPGTESSGPGPLVIAGGVSLGLAGLSLVGTFVSIGVRAGALSTVEDACPTLTGCDPSLQGDVDTGQTASTLVNVFAIGAGVLGAAGIGLMTAGFLSTDTEPKSAALELVPAASPSGAFVTLRGRFF